MLPFLGSEVPNRESSCAARLFVEVVHQQSTGRVDRLAFESPSFQTLNPAADGRHAQVDDRFVVPDGRHGTGRLIIMVDRDVDSEFPEFRVESSDLVYTTLQVGVSRISKGSLTSSADESGAVNPTQEAFAAFLTATQATETPPQPGCEFSTACYLFLNRLGFSFSPPIGVALLHRQSIRLGL